MMDDDAKVYVLDVWTEAAAMFNPVVPRTRKELEELRSVLASVCCNAAGFSWDQDSMLEILRALAPGKDHTEQIQRDEYARWLQQRLEIGGEFLSLSDLTPEEYADEWVADREG